ncbi:MAG: FxsA family protein [Acidimicrobiia bacterium]
MTAFLVVLFLVVPFVELFLLLQVGQVIGVVPTVVTLVAVSLLGGWLVKREGVGVWRRMNEQVRAGRVPGKELADAALILFGGALLLTPGFLTDILGVVLLVPPSRAVVRAEILRRLARRAKVTRW